MNSSHDSTLKKSDKSTGQMGKQYKQQLVGQIKTTNTHEKLVNLTSNQWNTNT